MTRLVASRRHIRTMQHHITTVNFSIAGEAAEGEVYTVAVHTLAAGDHDTDLIVGGRYLDKYEKRDGTWKISSRTTVTDWARSRDPSDMDMSHPITRGTLKGAVDASDPSYRFFSLM